MQWRRCAQRRGCVRPRSPSRRSFERRLDDSELDQRAGRLEQGVIDRSSRKTQVLSRAIAVGARRVVRAPILSDYLLVLLRRAADREMREEARQMRLQLRRVEL